MADIKQHFRSSALRYASILALGGGLFALVHFNYLQNQHALMEHYWDESRAEFRDVTSKVEDVFRQINQCTRTIARLPGVRELGPDAENDLQFHGGDGIESNTHLSIQEIYNSLGANVAVSELYIVPLDMDPDAAESTAPRQPLVTFDRLIFGGQARADAGEDHGHGELEEVEIYEYRLMKKQLAWMKEHYPRETDISALDYPMIGGPQVVTCDNTHYDPSAPDDRARSGLVLSMPYYGTDGELRGCVSAVILTRALQAHLPNGNYAISSAEYDYCVSPHHGGQIDPSCKQACAAVKDPNPIVSLSHRLDIQNLDGAWTLWLGRPDSDYWERSDVLAAAQSRNLAYGFVTVIIFIAIGGLWLVLRGRRTIIRINRGLEQSIRDQTAELESALRELKNQKLALDEHSIVSITDTEGDIIYVNDNFCEISGYTREELLGKNHRIIKSDEHDRAFYRDLWETISGGSTWRGEIKNHAKDGSRYWVDATIVPFKDEQGKTTQYVAVRTDITVMKESKKRLDLALAAAKQGLWDWNLTDDSTYFNDTWYTMLGYEPGELPMSLDTWERVCHPDDLSAALAEVDRYLRGETSIYRCEMRARMKDGSWKWILDVGEVTERDADGNPQRMVGVHIDIDQSKENELHIQESERRYKLAVKGSQDGLWDWDLLTDRVYYAPQWKKMLGLEVEEVSDRPDEWISRIDQRDVGAFMQEFDKHLSGEDEVFEVELRMVHTAGHTVWMLCRGAMVRNDQGRAIRVAGSFADITEIKHAQEKMQHMAEHDRLTELPNRELFQKRVQGAIDRSHKDPEFRFAVLFFDFDRFKLINDSLGHNVGDALLVDIAEQFRGSLRKKDLASRFGGDEFVVLLNDLKNQDDEHTTAQRLLDMFSQPHKLYGHSVYSTASIGLVTSSQDYIRAEEVIRDADAAMYQAKEAGRARVVEFDQKMHQAAVNRVRLESDLRFAIEREQLRLVYQPIIDLESGAIHGFEALLRWEHPTRGVVSPVEFIPIAEDTGLIVPIGEWVLREACQQIQQWDQTLKLTTPPSINVNLSLRQVCHPDIVDLIKTVLLKTRIDPSRLKLEITESTIVDDRYDMVPRLKAIRELGIKLAMDDFGTGQSSLGSLHRLPVDLLKIDQSFVQSITANRELAAVMQAIVTLAQNLGMATVAEGIETPEQLVILQALGCEYAQGYYFKPPLTPDQAVEYMLGKDQSATA